MTRWGHIAAHAPRAARGAGVVIAGLVQLAVIFEVVVRLQPFDPTRLERGFSDSIRIVDSRGQLLREVVNRDGARAEWRDLAEISPLLVTATLAVEDARFHAHRGIDLVGLGRAGWDNLRSARVVSGASTITMQLSRLLRPHRRSMLGKLGEMVDARRIERAVGKEVILEQYLNRAPYGAGAIGVEAASKRYFGKSNQHLSLAEAALLAGLPNAPTRLNPLRHLSAAQRRQRKVLDRMLATGVISAAEHDQGIAEPLHLRQRPSPLLAMHFTDYILAQGGHGEVRTTLTRGLQQAVEGAVGEHVKALALGGMTNAAVVVLDNERCQIRAMVGSVDYWDDEHGAVNGAMAPRQPGSTLKPFTYALAFEEGYTPASVVADIETRYGDVDGEQFAPQNFSKRFSGPVMMGDALGRSLNVPAIRVANLVGADKLLARLRRLGFDSLNKPASFYGLGLTLGNGEVTLVELAQAYAALARGGMSCTASGHEGERPSARVFSEKVAYLITDVLSDERLRIAAFGPANALLLGFPVAVKTGTSTNWRDSWAVGYTSRYTVAVWSGDFAGRSMNHLAGATGAGPLFHNIMALVVGHGRDHEPTAPRAPAGVVAVNVCALSGQRPGPHCPHQRPVHMLAEDTPSTVCEWHQPIAIDTRNGLRAGELCPDAFTEARVFEVLPGEYASWLAASGSESPPTSYSAFCPASGPIPGAVVITNPRAGEVFVIEPGYDLSTQSLELTAEAEALVDRITWEVDGRRVAAARWPYSAAWPLRKGQHQVTVAAAGQRGHTVTFEVR